MATAEELLLAAEMEPQAEEDQEEAICVIDPETREISVPARWQTIGVESDEKAERIPFRCPKIVGDGIDLSLASIRIVYRNANGNDNAYLAEDVQANGDQVTFSWELYRSATEYKGSVSFIMCAIVTDTDGTIEREWNTTLAQTTVLEGLESDYQEEAEAQTDIVMQLLGMVREQSEAAVAAVIREGTTQKNEITELGTAQKSAITQEGTARLTAIQSAGTMQVGNVNTAGAAQVAAVQAEGATQLAAIQQAAEEIAEDREQIQKNADDIATLQERKVDLAELKNIIIQRETGVADSHVITGSAEFPVLGMKVYGRSEQETTTGAQLLDWSSFAKCDYIPEEATFGGELSDPDADGWVTLSADNTEGSTNKYLSIDGPRSTKIEPDTEYLAIIEIKKITGTNAMVFAVMDVDADIYDGHGTQFLNSFDILDSDGIKAGTYTGIVKTRSGEAFDTSDKIFLSLFEVIPGCKWEMTFRISLIKDTTVTVDTFVWEPYTGGIPSPNPDYPQEISSTGGKGNIEVNTYGKNLLDLSKYIASTGITNVSCDPENGKISYDYDGAYTRIEYNIGNLKGKAVKALYTAMNNDNAGASTKIQYAFIIEGKTTYTTPPYAQAITIPKEASRVILGLYANNSATIKSGHFSIEGLMLVEADEEESSYEPYKPKQSLILATPGGLPGIPVSSGGNYTDENGRQWVCNEIDLGRGKYVQRVKTATFDGNEDEEWSVMQNGEYYRYRTNDDAASNVEETDKAIICSHYGVTNVPLSKGMAAFQNGTFLYFIVEKPTEINAVYKWREFISEHPLNVVYFINPVETDLTAEVIAAYRALHTNNPTTTVIAEAPTQITYAVDPERHIAENYVANAAFIALEERVYTLESAAINNI